MKTTIELSRTEIHILELADDILCQMLSKLREEKEIIGDYTGEVIDVVRINHAQQIINSIRYNKEYKTI